MKLKRNQCLYVNIAGYKTVGFVRGIRKNGRFSLIDEDDNIFANLKPEWIIKEITTNEEYFELSAE